MAGLTDTGFEAKRLNEILSDLITNGYSDYGLDTSSSAVVGRLIRLVAPSLSDSWEAAQEVYDSRNPSTATGINLDEVVAFSGIRRKGETYSTCPVLLTGDTNTLITSDRQITNGIGDSFTMTSDTTLVKNSCSRVGIESDSVVVGATYTVNALHGTSTESYSYMALTGDTTSDILNGLATAITSGSANYTGLVLGSELWFSRNDEFQLVSYTTTSNLTITKVAKIGTVQADDIGVIAVTSGTLINISNPISGWDSVINPTDGSEGRVEETDDELRARFFTSRNASAQNTIDAIYANLLTIDNVASVLVRENATDITDIITGLPPHSINAVVRGGSSSNIADVLWINKPAGIELIGTTEVEITDSQGGIQTIKFDRPDNISIYISMTIQSDGSFADDGEQQIRDAVSTYFDSNYGVGDDIIYSRLYTPINSVSGFQVNNLTIGTTASPTGMSNIAIADEEIGVVVDANIIITVLT